MLPHFNPSVGALMCFYNCVLRPTLPNTPKIIFYTRHHDEAHRFTYNLVYFLYMGKNNLVTRCRASTYTNMQTTWHRGCSLLVNKSLTFFPVSHPLCDRPAHTESLHGYKKVYTHSLIVSLFSLAVSVGLRYLAQRKTAG